MAITFPDFPAVYNPGTDTWTSGNGPDPKVATTPMDPYHVNDHNALKQAVNEIKSEFNTYSGAPRPWFAVNGQTAPWAFADGDTLNVSGVVKLGYDGGAASGTWTPVASDVFGGSPVINATWEGEWVKLGSYTYYIGITMKATGAWSNVSAVSITFPTSSWIRNPDFEQHLPGWCAHAGGAFGIHYPVTAIIHGSTVTGHTTESDPAEIRFIVPS